MNGAFMTIDKAHHCTSKPEPRHGLLCCSKRKVLRAWRLAVQQQAGDGPRSMSLQGPDSAAHPAAVQQAVDQEGPAVTADVLQQQSPRLQHQQQEHFAQSEAVAVKFHKLYHLHSCWCTWQQQATASALQRLREQQDKILAEEQTRVSAAAGCPLHSAVQGIIGIDWKGGPIVKQ